MKFPSQRTISPTVRHLRSILESFPDKDQFTVNENTCDLLIGCIKDGVEFRRAYYKYTFAKITPEEFRVILNDLK